MGGQGGGALTRPPLWFSLANPQTDRLITPLLETAGPGRVARRSVVRWQVVALGVSPSTWSTVQAFESPCAAAACHASLQQDLSRFPPLFSVKMVASIRRWSPPSPPLGAPCSSQGVGVMGRRKTCGVSAKHQRRPLALLGCSWGGVAGEPRPLDFPRMMSLLRGLSSWPLATRFDVCTRVR